MKQLVSSKFERRTTVVSLKGLGQTGVGEDVTYEAGDHQRLQRAGPTLPLAGSYTLAGFSGALERLELFPEPPEREDSRLYRRWAFESAALDLALRQAGRSLGQQIGLEAQPLRFVVSLRLGRPPSVEPLVSLLERYPGLQFKLDATSEWDERLITELVATGAVCSIDFKGAYKGTIVDQPPDAAMYLRVAEAFPDAWLEDPELTLETDAVLAGHRDRVTWDALIHSVADVEALPFPPRMLNIKPSRFGSLELLFAAYDHCRERGITTYGGGQFELGPGRGQIQLLAALFHPDTPNDVAPVGYNEPEPPAGLPTSPLDPRPSPIGFRWASD